MVARQLIHLLHLGKLDIRWCGGFYSISNKSDLKSKIPYFHVFLQCSFFSWYLEDASTYRRLDDGSDCRKLAKEIKAYLKDSSDRRNEKVKDSIRLALSGELDEIIKSHKGD